MVSGGAGLFSRSFAGSRRGRPEPRDQIQKAGGAQRSGPPAGPGVGEGGRRVSWVTCARRGPRPLPRCARACRPPGAAAAAWRRRAPRAGRWSGGQSPARRSAPGRGARGRPQKPFRLCKSHESGFPRAGAAMPAAGGRARAPLCRHRAGRSRRLRLRLLPARPGRRSAGPRALARAGPPSLSPSLPPSPAGWLARSLAPRLPGPAPSSLRSLQSASRLNLALWAAWSEGSWRGRKMGASARRKRRRRPRGPGLRAPPSRPAVPRPGRGGPGERMLGARPRSWAASACPNPAARVCFAERAVVFVLCAGGEGDSVSAVPFLQLTLDSVRRGLVVINTMNVSPASSGSVSESARGPGPRREPIARLGRTC